ncbi:TPA: hypothetical protein I8624_002534 [Serratia marcescens]|nr:hypothetical protein [Serratia marcescens]
MLKVGQFAGSENGGDFLYLILHFGFDQMLPNFPAAVFDLHRLLNFAGKAAENFLLRGDPDLVGQHPCAALRLCFVLQQIANIGNRNACVSGNCVLVVAGTVKLINSQHDR